MKTTLPLWFLRRPPQAKILRSIAQPVDLGSLMSDEFLNLLADMTATMYQANGIGLAAPQIGRSIQLAVIAKEVTANGQPLILINPQITKVSLETETIEEGCLSIPGVYGPVSRALQITVKNFDLGGQLTTFTAHDLEARVIQHEFDHLHGRVFIDRAGKITRGENLL